MSKERKSSFVISSGKVIPTVRYDTLFSSSLLPSLFTISSCRPLFWCSSWSYRPLVPSSSVLFTIPSWNMQNGETPRNGQPKLQRKRPLLDVYKMRRENIVHLVHFEIYISLFHFLVFLTATHIFTVTVLLPIMLQYMLFFYSSTTYRDEYHIGWHQSSFDVN